MTYNLESDLWACAHKMADAARSAILPFFRRAIISENKDSSSFDPVTEADRSAERAMRDVLGQLRPQDGILGEEYGHQPGSSRLTWVLDPIDGTRGFISGTPTWGVLIAVSDDTGPLLGIIDQPYIGERYCGGLGQATMTGPHWTTDLAVRQSLSLADATILTTFPEIGTETEKDAFHTVARACRLTRYGMDCYAYALLAAGQVDLVIEAGLQPYDIQAPIAVVQAAGGIVTDWTGGPAHHGGRVIAAATPELHAAGLGLLGRFL